MNPNVQKPVFLANWKMHFTSEKISSFFEDFTGEGTFSDDSTIGFAVPSPYLALTSRTLEKTSFLTGSQNIHWETEGAFTGEISAPMLRDTGVRFSLIGHSERRTYFGETNESVSKRAKTAISNDLIAVVCVGETKEEFQSGKREDILQTQIPESLSLLKDSDFSRLIIAYEPVWAIGTGLSATSEEAESAHHLIRNILKEVLHGSNTSSDNIPILYGGSVKEDNAQELITQKNIDGFLVGGASLKPDSFRKICSVKK